jgi:hypothetical protein
MSIIHIYDQLLPRKGLLTARTVFPAAESEDLDLIHILT